MNKLDSEYLGARRAWPPKSLCSAWLEPGEVSPCRFGDVREKPRHGPLECGLLRSLIPASDRPTDGALSAISLSLSPNTLIP